MNILFFLSETSSPEFKALKELRKGLQEAQHVPGSHDWWSTTNAMTMSAAVLVYSLAVMLLVFLLIKAGHRSEYLLRVFGTIMILTASTFLVVAGYSNDQIAPVTGLLGTIAGYLLGKGIDRSSNGQDPK
jgi:hypothetical protein